jgi:hypothetical protein
MVAMRTKKGRKLRKILPKRNASRCGRKKIKGSENVCDVREKAEYINVAGPSTEKLNGWQEGREADFRPP